MKWEPGPGAPSSPRPLRAVTPAEAAEFRTRGFVALRGILPPDWVDYLRRNIDRVVDVEGAAKAADPDAVARGMSARGHRADSAAMADVLERKKRGAEIALEPGAGARTGRNIIETGASLWDPQLCHFCVEGPLPEIVAQVLGVGTLHFFHDQVFKKEPGSGLRTPWHQDLPYFDLSGPCAVAWCPVDPVRMDNGAMCYIPGSHLDGRLYRPSDFVTSHGTFPGSDRDPSFSPLPRIDAAAEKELGAVYLDAEPGDVLVHDARTLHGSAGNVSGRVRRASSVRYVSGEARMVRREWSAIQWTNLIGVKDGELLAGDPGWYPKVWPRKSEGKGTRL